MTKKKSQMIVFIFINGRNYNCKYPKIFTFFIIGKKRSENTQRFPQMNITSNQERQQADIKRRAFQKRLLSRQNLLCFEILEKETGKNKQNKTLNGQKKKPFRKSNIETRY